MTHLLSLLLSLVLVYGYPILIAAILAGEIGLPIPTTSIIVAAGSFTVDGTFNIFILITIITLTAIAGDIIGYYIGKKLGDVDITRFTKRIALTPYRAGQIRLVLKRWGVWYIFFSRWLITPLGAPVNLIAGINNYPFSRFILSAAIGEFLWASIYSYLGYFFGVNWVSMIQYITNVPYILVLLILGILLLLTVKRLLK